jgi:hypothetical protein
LLIALYRAANIPARYVYGTVEISAEQAMNWVGGVTNADAAASLLSQGGIPTTSIVSGGKIVKFRIETVWVEAWLNYYPSRGAKHTPYASLTDAQAKGNQWVPMDASFKQYTYTNGLDIKANVPFNAQTLIDQSKVGATINESEGWVQNLNQANIQSQLTAYQNQVKAYVDAQRPNATVGDILGTKSIIQSSPQFLPGNQLVTLASLSTRFASLPENLRAQYRFTMFTGIGQQTGGLRGAQLLTHTVSLPRLAGRKITVAYVPATPDDETMLQSYLPAPHANGSPIEISELPTSLPAYLIRVRPEYRVDGQPIATATAIVMGSSVVSVGELFDPSFGWQAGADNMQTAGEYWATYVGGETPSALLERTQTKLNATRSQILANQPNDLTKEELIGDMFFATLLGYFSMNEASSRIQQRSSGAIQYRKPSFGHYGVSAKVKYNFGIARSVSFPSMTMDIDQWRDAVVMKDNSANTLRDYNRAASVRFSLYENSIPESIWVDSENPGEGISAVKALAIAAQQGQKIRTFSASNSNSVASLQVTSEIRQEILNAIAAGMYVTVHEQPVNVSGWNGTGYIIEDPDLGVGAYKISGGYDGGGVPWNQVGAGFGAMLDSLLKKYRAPNSMFGPDAERVFAKIGKKFSDIASVVNLVIDITKTLSNDRLNVVQKIIKIIGAAAVAVAGTVIGSTVGLFFFNPVTAVLLAMLLVVLTTILIDLLVDWAVGQLAKLKRLLFRLALEVEHA